MWGFAVDIVPQLEAGSLNDSVRDEMETNLGY